MEFFQVLGNMPFQERWNGINTYGVRPLDGSNRSIWELRNDRTNTEVVRTDTIVTEWHQDNFGSSPAVILWSDTYPTEVLLPDGSIKAGEPNDFVLVDNHACKHRISSAYVRDVRLGIIKPRMFIRGILDLEPTYFDIERWRAALR